MCLICNTANEIYGFPELESQFTSILRYFFFILLTMLFYSSTAGSAVGAGFGRGLGQSTKGIHERERVPPDYALWQSPRW